MIGDTMDHDGDESSHPGARASNGKLGAASMFVSSTAGDTPIVKETAVGKTDQYAHDGQRLHGDNTTKGVLDSMKGTRGNSKQHTNHGSLHGRPVTGVQSAPKPYQRGSVTPQGPAGHPNQKATMGGAGKRNSGKPGK